MKKQPSLLLLGIFLLALLTGCGSSSKSVANEMSMQADSVSPAMSPNLAETVSDSLSDSGFDLPEGRKWVITVDTSVETEDLDAMLTALTDAVAQSGGYLEHQEIQNGSTYSARRYRYADLTLRIPSENLDAFLTRLSDFTNVTSSSRSAEDVTLRYTDTQTRLKALETERDRLLELMEQAEDMADLLAIEDRLTQVRYELELYGSQLRELGNQIDYATVNLSATQVTEYTPVAEKTFWQRISTGFMDNLQALWEFLQDFAVALLSALPFLIPLGVLIWLVVLLCRRSAKKRREKRIAQWQAAHTPPQDGTDAPNGR